MAAMVSQRIADEIEAVDDLIRASEQLRRVIEAESIFDDSDSLLAITLTELEISRKATHIRVQFYYLLAGALVDFAG